jgi:hypothetical protein
MGGGPPNRDHSTRKPSIPPDRGLSGSHPRAAIQREK